MLLRSKPDYDSLTVEPRVSEISRASRMEPSMEPSVLPWDRIEAAARRCNLAETVEPEPECEQAADDDGGNLQGFRRCATRTWARYRTQSSPQVAVVLAPTCPRVNRPTRTPSAQVAEIPDLRPLRCFATTTPEAVGKRVGS